MNKKRFLCMLAILQALLMVLVLAWLEPATPVRADSNIRCVNQTGTGCDGVCGTCYASIQAAVNAASPGNQIRVAGGIYTDTAGTVATINKELQIHGGYSPDLSSLNLDQYTTLLDAQWGGSVISITNAGDVMLQHLTLTHGDGAGNCYNTLGCGGGIFVKDTTLHVGNCAITNNIGSSVGGGWGGGLYVHDSNAEIWGSVIVSNTASANHSTTSTAYGGGVYADSYGGSNGISLRNNQFLDNVGSVSAQGRGGGVYLNNLTGVEVLTNTFRGNRATIYNATSGWGGGLDIEMGSDVYVAGNQIDNNNTHANPSYAGYGGGVYIYDSDVHLASNAIFSNITSYGGGIFIRSEQPITLSNNLIVSNTSGINVTEYYSPSVSRALLVNNTIVENSSSGVQASFYGMITLTNNIIAGQSIGIDTPYPFSSTISADTNLFWNTTDPITGVNGIRQDPGLTANYHLRPDSPALDQGLTIPWLTTDMNGNPRPQGSKYDIGAFEGLWREVFLPVILR
jgi:hypothetical protein